MKFYMSGRDMIVEDITNEYLLGGTFRNFSGALRKDKTGRVVNTEGNRNFNLRIPNYLVPDQKRIDAGETKKDIDNTQKELSKGEEEFKIVMERCNVKPLKSKDDDGEPPIYFVKVNVKTESRRPPVLRLTKRNGRLVELTPQMYGRLDGMNIDHADLGINYWHNDQYEFDSLYLNSAVFTEKLDPISAKYDNWMIENDGDPNIPDMDADEVPFPEGE